MHILIPTDFSDNAFVAIDYVYTHFNTKHIEVTLLHAVEPPSSARGVMVRLDDLMKEDAIRDMAVVTKKIKEKYNHEPKTIIKHGYLNEWVKLAVTARKPDLIVMGTKGESNIASRIMGSVTESIIRTSHFPVLAVPVDWKKENTHTITIATEKTELPQKDFLIRLFTNIKKDNTRFNVLTVVDQSKNKPVASSMSLDKLHFNHQVVTNTSPVDGINEYLSQTPVDLLAVYHSHNSRLDYLFNRSVTKTICATVSVPLLVIPEKS